MTSDTRSALEAKLTNLAREIGNVESVLQRKSDPSADERQAMRRLRDWELRICAIKDELSALLTSSSSPEKEPQRHRRACECSEPDPVMQADAKFYCYRCSFETGARPSDIAERDAIRPAASSLPAPQEPERATLRADRDDWRQWHSEWKERAQAAEERCAQLRASITHQIRLMKESGNATVEAWADELARVLELQS